MSDGRPPKTKRLTGGEFAAALDTHDLSQREFCRITGASGKKVMQWADGSEDIPPWVAVFFAMAAVPGALDAARREAESRLLE